MAAILSGCCEKKQNDALSVIAARCSVRSYDQSRDVDEATIEILLRAAMAAPTAVNLQPWEFVVVKDKATLNRLAATNRFGGMIAKAPIAVIVCGDTLNEARGEPNKWWMLDCSAATENLLLAATAKGLGAVWTAVYPHDERVSAVRHRANWISNRCFGKTKRQMETREDSQGDMVANGNAATGQLHRADSSP